MIISQFPSLSIYMCFIHHYFWLVHCALSIHFPFYSVQSFIFHFGRNFNRNHKCFNYIEPYCKQFEISKWRPNTQHPYKMCNNISQANHHFIDFCFSHLNVELFLFTHRKIIIIIYAWVEITYHVACHSSFVRFQFQ